MKHHLQTFVAGVLMLFALTASAQNDCPAYPSQSKWERSCYISASTPDPTASDRQVGKLYLPEATFANKYGQAGNKSHIPDNRSHWALGIAHAWNYARNIQKNTKNPKISYWMAVPLQESQWACDAGAKWGDNTGWPLGGIPVSIGDDGCFQLEGVNNGSAYGALMQYYPQRFRKNEHPNLVGGNNFITSALVKAYYDLFTERIATYRWGWDIEGAVENTCDPYAFDKLTSSAYNAGIFGFQGAQSFMTGQENNCYWNGLPATVGGYSTQVGDLMAVLENNKTYPISTFTGNASTFDGYYNEAIKWSDVQAYLDEIDDMYWEIDFPTDVTPKAQAAFVKLVGSTEATIDFMDIGPVIDAVIMALPKEDPMQMAITLDGPPTGQNGVKCSGDLIPVAQIEVDGETTICSGQTTTLVAKVGGRTGYTFKWKKGETVVGTEQELIVTETAIGQHSYSLEVCEGDNCNDEVACDVVVDVEQCSNCNLTATATAKNATCTTAEDGEVTLVAQNGTGAYKVEYFSEYYEGEFDEEGNILVVENVPSGFYEIKLTDLSDANCFAYSSIEVEATVENNEVLNIESTKQNCTETLKASLEQLEKPTCEYTIRASKAIVGWPSPTDTTYQPGWEQWITAQINVNGQVLSTQANKLNYQWGPNSWDTGDFAVYNYELETDDKIDFSLILSRSVGSAQNNSYVFEVWNDQDQKLASYYVPANSAKNGETYKAGSYTVSCEASLPTYTFSWTPKTKATETTNTSSIIEASVNYAKDVEYVVTATNDECSLTEVITVKHDNNCSTCNDPGEVTLNQTGIVNLCSTEILDIVTSVTKKGEFFYELYRITTNNEDKLMQTNETGIFSTTQSGDYFVKVKDNSQLKDINCFQESNSFTIERKNLPATPTFTTKVNETCEGDQHLFSVNGVSNATSYVWDYTGENAIITTNGTSVLISFGNGATSGNVVVQAKNECELSQPSEVAIAVNKTVNPSVSIEASETKICEDSEVIFSVLQKSGAGENPTFVWKVNGAKGTVTEEIFKTSTLKNGDNVSVEMTSNATCKTAQIATSQEIAMTVDVCTSTIDTEQSDIVVYPNPTNGQLMILTNEAIQQVVVSSLDGTVLLETVNQELDLSAYATGVYLVKVVTENVTQIVKVEKK